MFAQATTKRFVFHGIGTPEARLRRSVARKTEATPVENTMDSLRTVLDSRGQALMQRCDGNRLPWGGHALGLLESRLILAASPEDRIASRARRAAQMAHRSKTPGADELYLLARSGTFLSQSSDLH